ncbi:MAG: DUF2141 domain-containing protein [Bacteroidetes bacterium]|jgi:uncharacterized protein (DUF2141 family)|nr:DUF2141 domain-containing protein [Bacteroidota bacterium]
MRFILPLLLVLLASPAPAQTPDSTGTLVVIVTGFETDDGPARIRLDATASAFAGAGGDESFERATAASIVDGTVVWTVDALPWGRYAASAYHDEDDDGTLDTNLFGAPSEPFGFSNDARARLGRPDFVEAAFRLAAPRDTIRFRVQ